MNLLLVVVESMFLNQVILTDLLEKRGYEKNTIGKHNLSVQFGHG